VDEREFPCDFATYIRYHTEFQEKIQDRWPMPDSLSLAEVDEFVAERRGKYPVRWLRSGVADSQYAAAA
jgi:hypothetical protein